MLLNDVQPHVSSRRRGAKLRDYSRNVAEAGHTSKRHIKFHFLKAVVVTRRDLPLRCNEF